MKIKNLDLDMHQLTLNSDELMILVGSLEYRNQKYKDCKDKEFYSPVVLEKALNEYYVFEEFDVKRCDNYTPVDTADYNSKCVCGREKWNHPNNDENIVLQVGMTVLIEDNKIHKSDSGTIKTITGVFPLHEDTRHFELDNEKDKVWLIEDFMNCTDYPCLKMI